jgi:rRNA maturation endonuclease Nob1
MKCSNCGVIIPPEWKKVIEKNTCPNCDSPIMNEAQQELLQELKQALIAMPADPEGLAGWLLDNYQMTKVGSGKPVNEFYDPNKKLKEEIKIHDNPFFKKTGLDVEKLNSLGQEKRKQLVSQIQAAEDDEEEFSSEEDDPNDPYVKLALSNMEGAKNLTKKDIRKLRANYEEEDDGSDDLPPLLQQDRLLRLQKQQDIASGTRSDKNGFSRG